MKMTLTERNQWTAALRSGEYEQAMGRLRNWHGYCCLGVLETIRGTECRLDEVIELGAFTNKYYTFGTNEKQTAVLTMATQAALSCGGEGFPVPIYLLTQEELVLVGSTGVSEIPLTHLNDSGISFTRIAELIELCVELVDEPEVVAPQAGEQA